MERKKVDVSYNPQLGYLKTIFTHPFDFLTKIEKVEKTSDGVDLTVATYQGKTALVRINFAAEEIFRLRMYPLCRVPEKENCVFDLGGYTDFTLEETAETVTLKTARLTLIFRKKPWEYAVLLDGKALTREEVRDSNVDNMCKYLPIGFDCDEAGNPIRVRETMYLYADENFYGFGEKFTGFLKRGQRIDCWQSDALSTNSEASYKNMPYFMSSRGYSVLLNTYTHCQFDMGAGSHVSYGMSVEDNVLDYVMFCERDVKKLMGVYTGQTGRSPMIPKWAFGFWMSKCSYRSQEEVLSVARRFRELGLPLDVIHIDGWQSMAYSGAWQWNLEAYPDPKGMIEELRSMHVHLSLWMWPYIGVGTPTYEYAKEHGFLVMDSVTGEPVAFPPAATTDRRVSGFDFTNPAMREWHRDLVKNVVKDGVGVIKTDFSEALPVTSVFYDGSNGQQGHNKNPLLYAKTIYEAMQEVKNETGERAMLWGRSGYAGTQNYPGNWAGDSSTHENNVACILRGGLSIGLSGVPFWGHDMGGFYNTDSDGYECPPTDTEYQRSVQFGMLSPLSRSHGKTPREPWNFSEESQKIFRRYAGIRYRLTPYLYSMAYVSHHTGLPMLRAMLLEFPDDPTAWMTELQYMLGDSLLVAPVFDQDDMRVYLPDGQWAMPLTGEIVTGGRWVRPTVTEEDIPLYMRENSFIPLRGHETEWTPEEPFTNLTVLMHVTSALDGMYYDDNVQAPVHAHRDGGTLQVETTMPMARLVLYSAEPLQYVVVNGKTYRPEQTSSACYQVTL